MKFPSSLLLFGKGSGDGAFNPTTYDANTVALWDGDVDLNTSRWDDIVAGSRLAMTGTPIIDTAVLNGHNIVTFNESPWATTNTPVIAPPFTLYFVIRPNVYGGNKYIIDDGVVTTRNRILYQGGTPNWNFSHNASSDTITGFTLGAFDICTIGVKTGAQASYWRKNNNSANTFTVNSAVTISGITLASKLGGVFLTQGHVSFAYIIMRSGFDSTETQDTFITFLKDRFAL